VKPQQPPSDQQEQSPDWKSQLRLTNQEHWLKLEHSLKEALNQHQLSNAFTLIRKALKKEKYG